MPDSQDDFDQAWAEIVEDLTTTAPEAGPATDNGDPDTGLAALFEPLREQQRPKPEPRREPAPDEFVDGWEDEGHFVPPPPPEIPQGTPIERLAWAGAIGGPLIILLTAFTGWNPPPIVGVGAGLTTLGSFVTLVWHLPEGRSDGWDDGARL